jgi:hypothetical protein
MARLTGADRKALPASSFGQPGAKSAKGGKGKYPMPDKSHAGNAKARAAQQVKKGNLSPSSEKKIDAKANKVLGKSGSRGK